MSPDGMLRKAAPLILLTGIVALWALAVHALDVPVYLLPGPGAIVQAFITHAALLMSSAWTTLKITLGAFVLAIIAGIGIALGFSASRTLSAAAFPLVIALQVTPVIAIAPLVVVWVGINQPQLAMLILATIVAFFPILASAMTGLRSTDPGLRALFQLYGASDWDRFIQLQIPSALPYLLSGLKVSGGLALVGAVVAEFVAGSGASQGLAFRIIEAQNRLETPSMFAALFLLTAMGLALYGALSLLERWALAGWHESQVS
jgi:NitT/TauT family transport system permease protein